MSSLGTEQVLSVITDIALFPQITDKLLTSRTAA